MVIFYLEINFTDKGKATDVLA